MRSGIFDYLIHPKQDAKENKYTKRGLMPVSCGTLVRDLNIRLGSQ
jgi:hypothetical protein